MKSDKILLFHPKRNMSYIRKLSMSYGYYTVLAVVNQNNQITHVGLDNSFQIVPFSNLTLEDKKILGSKRCSLLKDNDLLSVYKINKALELKHPIRLVRKTRNMRYASLDETSWIYHELKSNDNRVIVNNVVDEYANEYTDNQSLNVDELTFSLGEIIETLELEYANENTTIQTTLV